MASWAAPAPWPLGNIMSVGDLLIIVGLLVVLHRACRATQAAPLAALPRAPAAVN
jgi:hypothetical protein